MSAFLGPIHFWMYHKIQVQQSLVEDIIALSKEIIPGLSDELDQQFGESETRPLEEVIDEGNIHGWLQQCVSQVEYKLAYSVTELLKHNQEYFTKLEQIFAEHGKQIASSLNLTSATEAYKLINDSLLDGMPCDHVNSLVKESNEEVIWRKNSCVHGSYWDEVGGDVDMYYLLRDALIKGMLSGSSLGFEKIDKDTNRIR